ncbi:MAG: CoA pyrophosphatase [Deltaproteobacteria bacterium]|nr:CoA pyrophosphatase [Deltaproteobacteria bacterium]
METLLQALSAALRPAETPAAVEEGLKFRASVAVVLRPRGSELEVLVIQRAVRRGDRWSGHAALPGGKAEASDRDPVATAVRETFEEVGLDLSGARVLGALPEHPRAFWRRWERMAVTPVVFVFEGEAALTLNAREVQSVTWVPLAALRSPRHTGRFWWWWRPSRRVPLRVPFLLPRWRYESLLIWGMTHAILSDLLRALGRAP